MFKNVIRALRLPFISASVLPYIFGSLIFRAQFDYPCFFLGLISVSCTHLGANLINDYFDSKSGVDWKDPGFYQYFGGSKLIQEKVFSERFYLALSLFFLSVAVSAVLLLSYLLKSIFVIQIYLLILLLAVFYSALPFKLSYRRMGEIVIFLLFGPALVMGGYFIQTGIFPSLEGLLLSVPFGLLTVSILFSNEVPDLKQDKQGKKFTLASVIGPEWAFLLYSFLVFLSFVAVGLNVYLGYLKPFALFSFVFVFLAARAAVILRKHYTEKRRLMDSSRMTIALHLSVGVILIIGLFI